MKWFKTRSAEYLLRATSVVAALMWLRAIDLQWHTYGNSIGAIAYTAWLNDNSAISYGLVESYGWWSAGRFWFIAAYIVSAIIVSFLPRKWWLPSLAGLGAVLALVQFWASQVFLLTGAETSEYLVNHVNLP